MKCNKCGSKMKLSGVINLQDDYADKEEIFNKTIEKFECNKCEEAIELRKRLN